MPPGEIGRAPFFRMHRLLFTYPDMPAGHSFLPQSISFQQKAIDSS
jgi:hypothetical protein